MEPIENILPREYSIDNAIDEQRDLTVESFELNAEESSDIFGTNTEIRHNMNAYIPSLNQLAVEYLSGHCHTRMITEENHQQVRNTLYRAICFGFSTADLNLMGPYGANVMSYIRRCSISGVDFDATTLEVQQYLGERPNVDMLIGRFMPEIDQKMQYCDLAETFAGLTIMLAERDFAEQYLKNCTEMIKIEDFMPREGGGND